MKKLLSILLLSSMISCEKEEKTFEVKFPTATETRNTSNTISPTIYCRINGREVDVFNPLLGAPVYECKSGDVLEFYDSGYDYTTTTPTLNPPYWIYSYYEGYVESYILVDNKTVDSYRGNGNANLHYVIP